MLWSAFLMAGVLELTVFSFVDPNELHWLGGASIQADPAAVYTLAFFVFWAACAAAAGITLLLSRSESEINSRSFGR
ncbi:hypothetical protein [Rubrivivax gelatinosus]|uniref:hypothetical protein n=1 Tax=Rubrivivax gelatinosus TaxID=28068 RepID=UPI003211A44F